MKSKAMVRKKVVALVPRQPEEPGVLGIFARLARDPKLTVEKLKELVALQEHIQEVDARAAFDRDFDAMLPEIPEIARNGAIKNKEGHVQSRYSKYEDIRRVVEPVLDRLEEDDIGVADEEPVTLLLD